MKTRLPNARVIAVPISFPDVVGLRFECIDNAGNETGERYKGVRFTWRQIQDRYWISPASAKRQEEYLKTGFSVALKDGPVNGEFYGESETLPVRCVEVQHETEMQ